MSWYSDGEPFNDYDPPYCDGCDRGFSKAECDACTKRHIEMDCRAEGQRCETCVFYEWDVVDEVFRCGNTDSDWHNEEMYDDGWCDKWVED